MRYWLFQYCSVPVLCTSNETSSTGTDPPVPKRPGTGTKNILFWSKIILFWSKITQFWLFQYRSVPVPVRKMASTEREFPEYLRFPTVPHYKNNNNTTKSIRYLPPVDSTRTSFFESPTN